MARKPTPNDRAVPMPYGLLAPSTLPAQDFNPMGVAGGILGDVDVTIDAPDDGVTIDPATGAAIIDTDDGGVIVDFSPETKTRDKAGAAKHGANLAEYIDDSELSRIAEDLLLGIQQDNASRGEWLETRAQGIRLLGLKLEDAKNNNTSASTAVEGQSSVRHPLLLEATLRFQANAQGELLPASGPVKISNKVKANGHQDTLAEALEADMNYYLTSVATEYYPDTDRMLLYVGFGGCSFKKVYNCPVRRRPVSESVDAKNLIVSDAATDLQNSRRVTHEITMSPSRLKRMQLAGAYRDIDLGTANPVMLNAVDQEIANTQGVAVQTSPMEADRDHTIYECYCELEIRGFEDKNKGKQTGLALPYRVVIDVDSRTILEVRRNWKEGDELKLAKICIVKYSFVPGLGFYDIGLVHILGNTTNALTAAWREMLDAGMFANFPGFLYAKQAGRQNTNDFRVPPGGGIGIDTQGGKLSDAVMPLPYKDVSPAFASLTDQIAQTGQRLGGTAETGIGEGKQDAPVGTTLALLEQATKIESAVHKRLHQAQSLEFKLLKECFAENPQAFIDAVKSSDTVYDWTEQMFLEAINTKTLAPQADPNTPSHMHRLMKAQGYIQLDKAYPGMLNSKEIVRRAIAMMGDDNPEELFAPPQPNALPPEAMAKMAELKLKSDAENNRSQEAGQQIQLKSRELDLKTQQAMHDAQTDQAELGIKQQGMAGDFHIKQQGVIAQHSGIMAEAQKDQMDIAARQHLVETQAAGDQAELQMREHIAHLNFLGDIAKHGGDHLIAAAQREHESAENDAQQAHEQAINKAQIAAKPKGVLGPK